MCPRCAAKVAASRLAGEAVPPEILRAAKDAMKAHLNGGRVTEADMLALDADIRAAAHRNAEDFSPPDPYAPGIARQRAINDAKHPPVTIAPPLEVHYDAHGVPDAYFNDLQRMKEKR
jgi:hypothetical protein